MALPEFRLHDTASAAKRLLEPKNPPEVGLYVCGLTVDGPMHLGHARSALAFDVLVRVLRSAGYEVRFVRNFTDVDDKIIARARELGEDPVEFAAKNIEQTRIDSASLGLIEPDAEPRVTQSVDSIIDVIARLVDASHAYAADGDVYFDVSSWQRYGWVSHRAELPDEPAEGGGHGKRDARDFALWKAAKPGEPSWSSPWGDGRPGWHIECTAMLRDHFGPSVDVHGGGFDLVFPHHENEAAQGEAAFGETPYARHWVHNGTVLVDGEKMAKSRGNGVLLRDALAEHGGALLRFFFLRSHYRSAVDYRGQQLHEAAAALRRLVAPARTMGLDTPAYDLRTLLSLTGDDPVERSVRSAMEALLDDLNTPKALAALHDASRALASTGSRDEHGASLLRSALLVLGIDTSAADAGASADGVELEPALQAMLEERARARSARDWPTSDRLRDELRAMGVEVIDGVEGQHWRLVSGSQRS